MKLFSSKTYQDRRERLTQAVETGLIWLLGNESSPKNYQDNHLPYRQDSHFLYFAGHARAGLSLLIDLKSSKSYLCGADPSIDDVIWTGPMPSLREMADLVGIDETFSVEESHNFIQDRVDKGQELHYLPPYRADNQMLIADLLHMPNKAVRDGASEKLINAIIELRSIKEEQELDQMEQALQITKEMHLEVMYETKPGLFESDMVANLLTVAHRKNVDTAYPVILTVHGQTLHNHAHHHQMHTGQLLLGDFGAESEMYYAADITRTIPVDNQFSNQQKGIYQLVNAMLDQATSELRPGVPYRDIHLLAAKTMVKGLIEMGLMKGEPDDIVQQGAHALFFPHGLGHMIGLDVHDMEDLGEDLVGYDKVTPRSTQFGTRSLRLGKTLRPGFVLTVEPGIYFIPQLIDKWKAQSKFLNFIEYGKLDDFRTFGGIRIEDNYVITDNGARLLGDPIPRSFEEISFIRNVDQFSK